MSPLASVFESSVVRVMTGMAGVPGGTSHSCVTATMSSASPRANRMSVALGSSEQILMASSLPFDPPHGTSIGMAGGSLAEDQPHRSRLRDTVEPVNGTADTPHQISAQGSAPRAGPPRDASS